jgi:hypothetical protein
MGTSASIALSLNCVVLGGRIGEQSSDAFPTKLHDPYQTGLLGPERSSFSATGAQRSRRKKFRSGHRGQAQASLQANQ